MEKTYFAHRSEDGRWQTIEAHARGTAALAERFADAYGCGAMGCAAGLFHDVGKYAPAFQARLAGAGESYEHASAGMSLFYRRALSSGESRMADLLIAFAIAGHHTGLPDMGSSMADSADDNTFQAKLMRRNALGDDFLAYRAELGEISSPVEIPAAFLPQGRDFFSYQFLGRMLFSALVDADFLDTEAFMSNGAVTRDGGEPFSVLAVRFDAYMAQFRGKTGELNARRSEIGERCRAAADGAPGMYRLTVPTGGGKTLASMAFALRHLAVHGMKRIIYVIPYVSIIRQTVEVFSDIFGCDNVLAHYSTADTSDGRDGAERSQAELACENWDKPVVVTTNVQFFESLYANKTSRCRKLHNIADSVIIFDEAQMLPTELLRPCIRAAAELIRHYHCTAVLCTATQPALEHLLEQENLVAHEICPDDGSMYRAFARVRYERLGTLSTAALCERLMRERAVLCVLNRRRDVRACYEELKGEGVFHLSTYMTPRHIGRTIDEIRRRLAAGERCVVLSTSLIEVGVDVDFPVVYRELTGLDQIIQAGGRCNREGRRTREESLVRVFSTEVPSAQFAQVSTMTERIFETHGDVASPEAIRDYFTRLYRCDPAEVTDKLDKNNILGLICGRESGMRGLCYREVAERFRYIDSDRVQVLIPNEENRALCEALRAGKLTRRGLRTLAGDFATLTRTDLEELRRAGVISENACGIPVLEDSGWYDDGCGLTIKETGEAMFG